MSDDVEQTSSHTERPRWHAPLLPVAIGLILGIAVDNAFAAPLWIGITLALTIGLLSLAAPRNRAVLVVAVVIIAGVVGGLRHYIAVRSVPANHISTHLDHKPQLVTITGKVANTPRIVEHDPATPQAYPTPPKTRFVLDANSIAGRNTMLPASGRIRVTVKEPAPTLRQGEQLRITGWLYEQPPPANPGAYDWATHFRRQGLQTGLSLDHAAGLQRIGDRRIETTSWRDALRTRCKQYLIAPAFEPDEPEAGIVAAMILGERSAVPKALNEVFVKTGNAHFLAASGMHVGLLAAVVWCLLRVLRVQHRTGACVLAFVIITYVLLAEPRPSILRAGIVGVLGCLAILLQTRSNMLNWLSLAAIVVLLIDPTDCFRPAFQLSFVAVLAIVYVQPQIAEAIAAVVRRSRRPDAVFYFRRRPITTDPIDESWLVEAHAASLFRKTIRYAVQLFLVSVAVWLSVMPLSCYHFHQFTPWGPLNTMLLWLIAAPVTCLGFLTMLLGAVFPSSGRLFGPLLDWGTDVMVGLVQWLARIPGTIVDIRPVSLAWVAAVYAVLLVWVIRPAWAQSRPRLLQTATAALIAWWLLPIGGLFRSSEQLDAWVLAVGDGTAIVLELPNDETWLFDLGTRSNLNAGRIAGDLLSSRDIGHIDTAVISHPNFDHYGGLATLARSHTIDRVLINDHFEVLAESDSQAQRFLDEMQAGGAEIERLNGPSVLVDSDGLHIETLWPPPASKLNIPDANESSTVLSIRFQGRRLILTGDNDEYSLTKLCERDDLVADVLLLPHHGAAIHATPGLIEAVSPTFAIRSSGRRRYASLGTIEAIVAEQAYFNTADDGCVRVTIADNNVRVSRPLARD